MGRLSGGFLNGDSTRRRLSTKFRVGQSKTRTIRLKVKKRVSHSHLDNAKAMKTLQRTVRHLRTNNKELARCIARSKAEYTIVHKRLVDTHHCLMDTQTELAELKKSQSERERADERLCKERVEARMKSVCEMVMQLTGQMAQSSLTVQKLARLVNINDDAESSESALLIDSSALSSDQSLHGPVNALFRSTSSTTENSAPAPNRIQRPAIRRERYLRQSPNLSLVMETSCSRNQRAGSPLSPRLRSASGSATPPADSLQNVLEESMDAVIRRMSDSFGFGDESNRRWFYCGYSDVHKPTVRARSKRRQSSMLDDAAACAIRKGLKDLTFNSDEEVSLRDEKPPSSSPDHEDVSEKISPKSAPTDQQLNTSLSPIPTAGSPVSGHNGNNNDDIVKDRSSPLDINELTPLDMSASPPFEFLPSSSSLSAAKPRPAPRVSYNHNDIRPMAAAVISMAYEKVDDHALPLIYSVCDQNGRVNQNTLKQLINTTTSVVDSTTSVMSSSITSSVPSPVIKSNTRPPTTTSAITTKHTTPSSTRSTKPPITLTTAAPKKATTNKPPKMPIKPSTVNRTKSPKEHEDMNESDFPVVKPDRRKTFVVKTEDRMPVSSKNVGQSKSATQISDRSSSPSGVVGADSHKTALIGLNQRRLSNALSDLFDYGSESAASSDGGDEPGQQKSRKNVSEKSESPRQQQQQQQKASPLVHQHQRQPVMDRRPKSVTPSPPSVCSTAATVTATTPVTRISTPQQSHHPTLDCDVSQIEVDDRTVLIPPAVSTVAVNDVPTPGIEDDVRDKSSNVNVNDVTATTTRRMNVSRRSVSNKTSNSTVSTTTPRDNEKETDRSKGKDLSTTSSATRRLTTSRRSSINKNNSNSSTATTPKARPPCSANTLNQPARQLIVETKAAPEPVKDVDEERVHLEDHIVDDSVVPDSFTSENVNPHHVSTATTDVLTTSAMSVDSRAALSDHDEDGDHAAGGGGGRSRRRAAAAVSYKEPPTIGKARRIWNDSTQTWDIVYKARTKERTKK